MIMSYLLESMMYHHLVLQFKTATGLRTGGEFIL
jgi:hypothetical protein